jgi:hypothetical protein
MVFLIERSFYQLTAWLTATAAAHDVLVRLLPPFASLPTFRLAHGDTGGQHEVLPRRRPAVIDRSWLARS